MLSSFYNPVVVQEAALQKMLGLDVNPNVGRPSDIQRSIRSQTTSHDKSWQDMTRHTTMFQVSWQDLLCSLHWRFSMVFQCLQSPPIRRLNQLLSCASLVLLVDWLGMALRRATDRCMRSMRDAWTNMDKLTSYSFFVWKFGNVWNMFRTCLEHAFSDLQAEGHWCPCFGHLMAYAGADVIWSHSSAIVLP